MKFRNVLIGLLVLTLTLSTVSAQELKVTNATVIQTNQTGWVDILLNWTGQLENFAIQITYDSSKIDWTGGNDTSELSSLGYQITCTSLESGNISIVGFYFGTQPPTKSLWKIASLEFKPLVNDGSIAWINISPSQTSLTGNSNQPITVKIINGTFKTPDTLGPEITFDKNNTQNLGSILKLNAMIKDWSGVDISTIKVSISNDTKTVELINGTHYNIIRVGYNPDTVNVLIDVDVAQWFSLPITPLKVTVYACDLNGTPNCNSNNAYIDVVQAGFYGFSILNGVVIDGQWFLNQSYANITVEFASVDTSTINLWLDDNLVPKTAYTIVGTTIYFNTTSFTPMLDDGVHWINITGKLVDGSPCNSINVSFIVDTHAPTIHDFNVTESDGDTLIERFENLTVSWNVSDNIAIKEICIVYTNGQSETIIKTIVVNGNVSNTSTTIHLTEYGGKIKLIAYDKAGNKSDSSEIGREYYVYNNYLAYAKREQPKTVMGLNVTKLATLDLMDRDIVNITIFNGTEIKLPVSKVERRIITGSKAKYTVYVDRNANKTITNFYQNFVVLDANTMLDFYVKAPARALLMVIRLNDSKAENLAKEFAEKWSVKGLIKLDELDEYIYNVPNKAGIYLFNDKGWRGGRYDSSKNKVVIVGTERGKFYNKTEADIKTLIKECSVDLSNGFRLSDHDANYSKNIDTRIYSVRPKLEPGAYVLLAIGLDGNVSEDNYIVSLNAMMPIIVVNGTLSDNKPSINDSVTVGDTIRIEFPSWVNRTAALMIMDKTYQADITVNMTKAWHHIARLNITYPGKDLRELMYKDKHTKVWIPKRMGKGAYKKSNVISIDTSGLDEGNYIIYIVAQEYGGIVYYAGVLTVSVMRDTVPPTISVDAKPKEVWLEFNGTGYKPNTTTISFTVSDKSGVKKVIVEIWNETEMLNSTSFDAGNTTKPFSESVTFTVSLPGTYTAIVKAWDAYGNYNEAKVNFYGIGYYPVTRTVPKNKTTEVQVSKDVNVTIVASPTANATVNLTVQESTTNETFKINATEGVVKYINVSGVAENVSVLLLKFRYENVRPFVYWWNKSKADWENVTDYTYDYDKTLIFNVTKLALDKGYTNLTDFLKDPVFALVAKLPDLTVVNIITPDNMVEGNTYPIKVKVKNIGTANATAFNVTLSVNGKQIGKKTVTLLNISEVKDVTFSWTPSSSGTFTLKAVVDPENVVKELNEANNMKSKSVTVKSKVVHVPPVGAGGGGYIVTAPPIVAKPVVEFKTTEYFTAEKPKTITLPLDKSDKIGIVSVTVKVPFSISLNVIITKAELPATIPSPKYDVYTFVEIAFYKGTGELVKPSGEIEFKVSKSWMNEKGYSKDQIVLMKYEKVWKELPTEYVKEDTNYYYFKAKVSSFSIFAIAAKPKVVITPTTPPVTVTTTVPPTVTTTVIPPPPYTTYAIIAVIVIVIIAVIAYVIARRR